MLTIQKDTSNGHFLKKYFSKTIILIILSSSNFLTHMLMSYYKNTKRSFAKSYKKSSDLSKARVRLFKI